ncbi:hypothetical protein EJB05_37362, partial [Eragrostis curvula]
MENIVNAYFLDNTGSIPQRTYFQDSNSMTNINFLSLPRSVELIRGINDRDLAHSRSNKDETLRVPESNASTIA